MRASPHENSRPAPCCRFCGRVIGVYEPLIAVDEEGLARKTSRAAEPGLTAPAGGAFHLECYREVQEPAA